MPQPAARIVSLSAGGRRRPIAEQRVVYELARMRIARLREPPAALAQLSRRHD